MGCFDNEKIAFVEYHRILPIFSLNDFNWTQTPSAVDEKTVETVRGVIPQDKVITFRFGADDAELNDATYNSLLATLRAAHKALASEIELKVYEYGFLKR